ncbi:hypothetical protein [Chryseobacterium taiwanense]|nr:hypothetical protein [Chryseobacterium taiwanense]
MSLILAMIKVILKFGLFSLLFLGITAYSQEKKHFTGYSNILQGIIPNQKTDFWILVHSSYGKNQEVKTVGTKKDYTPQTSGFNLFPDENGFFYIVSSSGGKIEYITDLPAVKKFIGKIDNVEEAAIMLTAEGYFVDEEFNDLAGNYSEDNANYYLEVGKLTSKECPYQKKHFNITVSKAKGEITNTKDDGTYIELYNKKCTNNPRLLKIEKKETPKDEPKKSNSSTKRR